MLNTECKAGTYVVYVNGTHAEIGRIVKLRDEHTAWVCYHGGETAAATDLRDLKLLVNSYVILLDDIGGERFEY